METSDEGLTRFRRSSARIAAIALLCLLSQAGCGREFYREWANQDVSEAVFAPTLEPNALALARNLRDVVAEYDQKVAAAPQAIADFEAAGDTIKAAACVGGTWGDTSIETGSVSDRKIKESLLKSAWRHVYSGLSIESIASAADKRRFQQAMLLR